MSRAKSVHGAADQGDSATTEAIQRRTCDADLALLAILHAFVALLASPHRKTKGRTWLGDL